MKTITISGKPGSGKSTLAQRRYNECKALGLSVAMLDDDSYGVFYSDAAARTSPEVKIVTKMTNGPLEEVLEGRI